MLRQLYDGLRTPGQAIDLEPSAVVIGTDPTEWWQGPETLQLLTSTLEAAGPLDLVGSAPVTECDGNLGWVSDRPVVRLPDGTEVQVRVTGVARSIRSDWKWLQLHLSLGVDSALPPELVAITSRPHP